MTARKTKKQPAWTREEVVALRRTYRKGTQGVIIEAIRQVRGRRCRWCAIRKKASRLGLRRA